MLFIVFKNFDYINILNINNNYILVLYIGSNINPNNDVINNDEMTSTTTSNNNEFHVIRQFLSERFPLRDNKSIYSPFELGRF